MPEKEDEKKEYPDGYDHDHENEVTVFAETNFRSKRRKFGIKTDDRRRHFYVIGKTGMGKTTLLENMVLSDIYAGHGVAYVDPHGDTAQKLLDFIPPHRINDVVYFNPSDLEYPIGFNILETVDENHKHLVAAGLMGVFKKIWPDVWSARMEYILLNTIMALLDYPGATLLGMNRLLADEEYRKRVVSVIQDPLVKSFWVKEFAAFNDRYRQEAVAPVQNKIGQFLSASIIRNVVAQVKSTINMRDIMDNKKIFIVNLSKGLIGEENTRLLGAMVITRLQLSAMERVDTPEEERRDFYLYVDEFQNFATESFADILSEARKYRLNLIVAHQYIEQLTEEKVRAAIFGNVGTILSFRVGASDAEELAKEFAPRFTEEDLVNLTKFDVYLKLMINGSASEPFSAATLPPIAKRTGSKDRVIKVSRERYSRHRGAIEERVLRWSGLEEKEEPGEGAEPELSESEKDIAVQIEKLETTSPKISGPAEKKPKKEAKYEMPCSVCGAISKLTFEPDKSRPWFCKEHLDIRSQEKPAFRSTGKKFTRSEVRKPRFPAREPDRKSSRQALPPPPSLGSGRPVIKTGGSDEEVSLSALMEEAKDDSRGSDKKREPEPERPADKSAAPPSVSEASDSRRGPAGGGKKKPERKPAGPARRSRGEDRKKSAGKKVSKKASGDSRTKGKKPAAPNGGSGTLKPGETVKF